MASDQPLSPSAPPSRNGARPAGRRGRRTAAALAGVALLAALLVGCGKTATGADSSSGGAGGQAAPPPPAVTVSHPVIRRMVEQDEYTGHLSAPEMVNLEARVSGLIVAAPFEEGAMVKKGDVLFVIDDRPFKATLDARKADIARAQSQEALMAANLKRLDKIHNTRAISEEDYDTAKAMHEQAIAAMAAAKAAYETAKLNLDWTRVIAPITGRIGRRMVTVGNLVTGGGGGSNGSGNAGGGTATLLTTIVSIDPIYCYVDVPEESYLKYQALARQQALTAARDGTTAPRVPCALGLSTEADFPHPGFIDFTDNTVDPRTGTVQVRGVFANPGALMTPGLSARMRIPGSAPYDAVLVPDIAIATSQSERYVMVVGNDDTVAVRPVQLGTLFGDLRAITSGLKADDLVIINGIGLPQVRAGGKVAPQEAPIQAPPTPAAATQPGPAAPAEAHP